MKILIYGKSSLIGAIPPLSTGGIVPITPVFKVNVSASKSITLIAFFIIFDSFFRKNLLTIVSCFT